MYMFYILFILKWVLVFSHVTHACFSEIDGVFRHSVLKLKNVERYISPAVNEIGAATFDYVAVHILRLVQSAQNSADVTAIWQNLWFEISRAGRVFKPRFKPVREC